MTSYSYPFLPAREQHSSVMVPSTMKLPTAVLPNFSDYECDSNLYKNLMLNPNWQWRAPPEAVPPLHLPQINRYGCTGMPPLSPPINMGPTHQNSFPEPGSYSTLHAAVRGSPSLGGSVSSPNIHRLTSIAKTSPLTSTPTGSKRGRPRADVISTLQYFGSNSTCTIRCHICHRVFPREKSLQAHLRTHTGERPYRCDYPNCTKSFVQSGQLKTHQRLHSGEKPFKCSGEGCPVRFTHANRHCPDHPNAKLLRDDRGALEGLLVSGPRQDTAISSWLDKYVRSRLDRTNSANRSNLKRESSETYTSSDEDSNHGKSEVATATMETPKSTKISLDLPKPRSPTQGPSVKRQLLTDENRKLNGPLRPPGPELDDPAVRIPLSPKRLNQVAQPPKIDPRQPVKKRILAYNEQLLKQQQQQQQQQAAEKLSAGGLGKLSLPPIERPLPAIPSFPAFGDSPRRRLNLEQQQQQGLASTPIASVQSLLSLEEAGGKSPPPRRGHYSFLRELKSTEEGSGCNSDLSPSDNGGQKAIACSVIVRRDSVDQSSSSSSSSANTSSSGDTSSDQWDGAMALMQLASSPPSRKISSNLES